MSSSGGTWWALAEPEPLSFLTRHQGCCYTTGNTELKHEHKANTVKFLIDQEKNAYHSSKSLCLLENYMVYLIFIVSHRYFSNG